MTWGLDAVTVRHGERAALDAVSVSVSAGQVVSVVGGDGAGKSTICRVLVGLTHPVSGLVRVPERIGYVPDGAGVWPDLTVLENLDLVASVHRLPAADRQDRIDELLAVTGLADAAGRQAGALSGGMRQKLAVAAAVIPGPELLVLDEASTGLDPVSRDALAAMVSGLVADGMAVVATTTYVDEAERSDRVLVLDEGRCLAEGAVDDVRRSMPGVVGRLAGERPDRNGRAATPPPVDGAVATWRRGDQWRAWFPDGRLPAGVKAIRPDLSDLVLVAALVSEERWP